MVHKLLFFTLYLFSINLFCSQNNDNNTDFSDWEDLSQDLEKIIQSSNSLQSRQNIKKQFIKARTIIEELRTQLEELNENEEGYLTSSESIISTANSQINVLNDLADSLEIKQQYDDYNIHNSLNQCQSFDPRNGSLTSLFSNYIVKAEVIYSEILKTTQKLGIPLDDNDPNSI